MGYSIPYEPYDLEVIMKTVWLESRGEPQQGQIAVAYVIKNRARANRSYFGGKKISDVCLHPSQFEPWNNKKPEGVHPKCPIYDGIGTWIRDVLNGSIDDPTNGALYFINPDICGYPEWTNRVEKGFSTST